MSEKDDGPLGFGSEYDLHPEDREELDPERGQRQAGPVRPPGRYTAIVALVFVALIVVAGINALSNRREGGVLGVTFAARGWPLPQFAVADARGHLTGDANVAQDNCTSSALPCPASNRRRPACSVRGAGIIRVCDLFSRPLVISFWFSRGGDCEPQQEVVDGVASRFRGVRFLSLNIHDKRNLVRKLIRTRHWRLPIGLDPDGAVSNLYRVGGCPTFLFAYPGGIAMSSYAGTLNRRALTRRVRGLVRASGAVAAEDR